MSWIIIGLLMFNGFNFSIQIILLMYGLYQCFEMLILHFLYAWFSQLQKLMWCHRFWFLKEVQLWKRQNLNNGVIVYYFFQSGCYQIFLISPKISGERALESVKVECLTHNRYSRNITFVYYFPLFPMFFKLKHPN